MKTTFVTAFSRSLLPALLLALLAVFAGFLLRPAPEPPLSDTDARIAWYRERASGRGSYSHYARLGLAYLQKARETGQSHWYDAAERNLRTSLAYQVNFEAFLGLGTVLSARHHFREALPFAEQAAASVPGSPEAQGLLFEIHLALGDTAQAEQALDAVAPSQSTTFEISSRWAALAEYRGWPGEALRKIDQACANARARRLPPGVQAWCAVRRGALLLNARCDAPAAEQAYQQALRIFPNYYFAREHLAELRAAQGNTADAIALYEALLRDLPAPVYRLALADLYETSGRAADAQRERASALAELQRSVANGAREHLREYVLLVAEQKEYAAEALRLAESEWAARRDAYTADALAWTLLHNRRLREASEMAAQAIAPGIQVPAILLHATEVSIKAEQWGQARDLVRQVESCPAAMTPSERRTLDEIKNRLSKVREIRIQ